MEASRTSKVLWMLLYSVVTGITLALFTIIDGMIKYLFSLAALYFVIKFFKRSDSLWYRIGFVLLTLLVFFIFIVVLVMYTFMKENYGV